MLFKTNKRKKYTILTYFIAAVQVVNSNTETTQNLPVDPVVISSSSDQRMRAESVWIAQVLLGRMVLGKQRCYEFGLLRVNSTSMFGIGLQLSSVAKTFRTTSFSYLCHKPHISRFRSYVLSVGIWKSKDMKFGLIKCCLAFSQENLVSQPLK